MKEIQLTRGQVTQVDDDMYEYISQWKWFSHYNLHTHSYYAVRSEGKWGHQKAVYMHRFIANAPDGMHVDHINHDTLYNLRENLRVCTAAQNRQNGKKYSNNTSGHKGVCWDKHAEKWAARITSNNKSIHLGLFADPEEAAHAYDEAAKKLHGEFAVLNFPTT